MEHVFRTRFTDTRTEESAEQSARGHPGRLGRAGTSSQRQRHLCLDSDTHVRVSGAKLQRRENWGHEGTDGSSAGTGQGRAGPRALLSVVLDRCRIAGPVVSSNPGSQGPCPVSLTGMQNWMADEPPPRGQGSKGEPSGESWPLSDGRGERYLFLETLARECFCFLISSQGKREAIHTALGELSWCEFSSFSLSVSRSRSRSRHHMPSLKLRRPRNRTATRTPRWTRLQDRLPPRLRFLVR